MIWLHVGVDARIDLYMQKTIHQIKKREAHICAAPLLFITYKLFFRFRFCLFGGFLGLAGFALFVDQRQY